MICQDLYLKYTPKIGTPVVRYHRVWDKDLFLKARIEEGIKADPPFTIQPVEPPPLQARKI